MSTPDEKIIELSQGKITLTLFGACVFASAGAWMFYLDDAEIISRGPVHIPLLVHGFGLTTIIVCALAVILGLRKLFDTKPGLVFNSAGIVDNSSALAAGFIPWSDISGAKIFEEDRRKLLIIKLVNPDKYIEVGNKLTRALNRKSYKAKGSPIAIPCFILKVGMQELLTIFDEYFQKYGKPSEPPLTG